MQPEPIHFPTAEETKNQMERVLSQQRSINLERRVAVAEAFPALERLLSAMQHGTDQSLALRSLLFSLWNGKAVALNEMLRLNWELKQDFCRVVLAFGLEFFDAAFFYDALKTWITAAGLWDWFVAEGDL